MRTSSSFSLLLLLLLFCVILLSSSSSSVAFHRATAQTLIHDTCKTCAKDDPNVNFTFCTASLEAAPASHCAGLHGLGMISIRLVRDNVTDTQCQIKQLLKNRRLDPYVKGCLQDCYELYSDAIPSAKQAMKYYNSKRYVEANGEISSVMDAATTCEDGFLEKEGVVSPLTKRNGDTFELSAMVISIMNMVQTGSH